MGVSVQKILKQDFKNPILQWLYLNSRTPRKQINQTKWDSILKGMYELR